MKRTASPPKHPSKVPKTQHQAEEQHVWQIEPEWEEQQEQDGNDVPLTPFNLHKERQQGSFDDTGFYQPHSRNRRSKAELLEEDGDEEEGPSEDEDRDQWLEQWKEEEKRKKEKREMVVDEVKRVSESHGMDFEEKELLVMLLIVLEKGESVLEGVRRLGKFDKRVMELLTGIADELLGMGMMDVYEISWEEVSRKIRGGEKELEWEYKWEETGPVYGMFKGSDMEGWAKEGYFENVQVRVSEKKIGDYLGWIPGCLVTTYQILL